MGGRLIVEAGTWRLVDATGQLGLRLADDAGARHEALAVAEGTLEGDALSSARLCYVQPSAAPALEWQRLFRAGTGARLELRARLVAEVRRYFESQGFLEVDTPLRSAECGTETHVEPLASGDHYLITSPELR